MLRIGLLASIGSINRNRSSHCNTRIEGRQVPTRRRRKKASPFHTITLWVLFLIFVVTASVFFVILLYLDLITKEKNTKELALSCSAFGVSVLMALRIWFSLPNDDEEPPQSQPATDRGHHIQDVAPVGNAIPYPEVPSNSTNIEMFFQDRTSGNEMIAHHGFMESPGAKYPSPSLPPAYSTLNLMDNPLNNYEEPPKYEDAMHLNSGLMLA